MWLTDTRPLLSSNWRVSMRSVNSGWLGLRKLLEGVRNATRVFKTGDVMVYRKVIRWVELRVKGPLANSQNRKKSDST